MEDLIYNTNRRSQGLCCRGIGRQDHQLNTYDWLADIPGNDLESQYVEVQFKNGIIPGKYQSGLPFPPPGNLPDPGIEPLTPVAPALVGRFFTTESPGKPYG